MAENPTNFNNFGSTEHPPLNEAMALIHSLGIKKLRVLHPDHNLLKVLANTKVEVNLGIPDEDLRDLALSSEHACRWVSDNIKPFSSSLKIRYISVGNDAFFGEERLRYLVLPAMQNVYNALHSLDKDGLSIQVSTSVGIGVLAKWTNTSDASFRDYWIPFLHPIVEFLAENKLPLMVNVFPYNMNEKSIAASSWTNSFERAVAAFYFALEKIGYPSLRLVASSTGWPFASGESDVTTTANALAYNQCLVKHLAMRFGTQKKPNSNLSNDAYFFTLINSKWDSRGKLEWGLFDCNMHLVYRQGFLS